MLRNVLNLAVFCAPGLHVITPAEILSFLRLPNSTASASMMYMPTYVHLIER